MNVSLRASPRLSSQRFISTVNKLGAGIQDITGTVLTLKYGPSMASFSAFNKDCSEDLTQRLHHFSLGILTCLSVSCRAIMHTHTP